MRIYLTKPQVVDEVEDGRVWQRQYACPGFYKDVPEDRARAWIDAGLAFTATEDNLIVGYRFLESVLVNLDRGESFEGLTPREVEPPVIEPVAEPESLPVEASVEPVDDGEGEMSR